MNAIELLLTRQSDSKLTEPGPSPEQLDIIKQAALRVPDHGCIAPWQFIIVQGAAREKLGEIYLADAMGGQGIELWFAYFMALMFLVFRPQGMFGEKFIERV